MTRGETLVGAGEEPATPIEGVEAGRLEAALAGLDEPARRFAERQHFKAEAGSHILLPDAAGTIGRVLLGLGDGGAGAEFLFGKLGLALPGGLYGLAEGIARPDLAALAFALGGYRFERYRKPRADAPRLEIPAAVDALALRRIRDGVFLARDLINVPANDLSPHDLADSAGALAERFGAVVSIVEGEKLRQEYPLVHAVGAASDRPPCLVDMRWGSERDPKVTLVGKGIVFDTGGLDIKPATAMALMKKDMGGAANVLGLAFMIMDAGLKLRLRVIVPAAENAISGRAFRPGDILKSRKGPTVEIGNTDAEGRLVLADALALADEEAPALLVSIATLTGAARVALGPEIAPFFTEDDAFAQAIERTAADVQDPLWRMPLWKPYDAWLKSKAADLNHVASNAYAGSIVAALFLRRFVSAAATFAHFDIFGWNPSARPLGPEGGEAQAIRALYRHLSERFG